MQLQEIDAIKIQLNSIKAVKIKLLHTLIFYTDKVRENRKELRQFSCFPFTIDESEFITMHNEITHTFDQLQLITLTNLLSIDIQGNVVDIAHCILMLLSCPYF